MEFYKILKIELQAQKISAYKLAKLTGISKVLISYYVNGKSEPTITNLKKICLALDVSADYLLGIKEYY